MTLPLPSRNEECEFTLRPVSQTVNDLVSFVQAEDGGIDRIAVYTMEGKRVSHSTPIDILIQGDFKIVVNDKTYDIIPPKPGTNTLILLQCYYFRYFVLGKNTSWSTLEILLGSRYMKFRIRVEMEILFPFLVYFY